MTILEAAAAIRTKKISSVELTEQSLKAIASGKSEAERFHRRCSANRRSRTGVRDGRGVIARPRSWSADGVPIAHKDLVMTRGVRTTAGSKIFADFVPGAKDAVVATKLKRRRRGPGGQDGAARARVRGSRPTILITGAIHNPWDLQRIPGGSSGGSGAAVAAGLVRWRLARTRRIDPDSCGVLREPSG